MKKTLMILSAVFLGLLCLVIFYFKNWLNTPVFMTNNSVEYVIPYKSSFTKVAYDLSRKGIITHPRFFIFYSSLTNHIQNIKYGTYSFSSSDTPNSILQKLIEGRTMVIKVTIPEGYNIYQIAQKFEGHFPLVNKQKWQEVFSENSALQFIGIQDQVKNLEGFLFPNTYFFDPHADPKALVRAILIEFKTNVTPQMFAQAHSMGLSPLQFITLASIVEKETALPMERNKIAAVYWNRIKKRMRLQADPTVIYGIWNTYGGALTKKDLRTPTLYNTYFLAGLPVAPIANPGLESIRAVLNPAPTDDLYFVANGLGGHTFSRTLKEHNRAVQHYLRYLRTVTLKP